MTEFEKQFHEVQALLEFKEYNQVIKRLIDFTLDSESINYYQKTNDFLDWNDTNEQNEA
jgi:ABC-2 type transport system ATP-binding protein